MRNNWIFVLGKACLISLLLSSGLAGVYNLKSTGVLFIDLVPQGSGFGLNTALLQVLCAVALLIPATEGGALLMSGALSLGLLINNLITTIQSEGVISSLQWMGMLKASLLLIISYGCWRKSLEQRII